MSDDFGTLDPETYHQVIGPALQAAAETAARRGHRGLFDDMPAMLALINMVAHLAELQRGDDRAGDARRSGMLDKAPMAASVMVFQEAEMPPEAMDSCLSALEIAYRQLHEQSVIDAATPYIAMAAAHLEEGQREAARECLTSACEQTIAAIELWRGEQAH